MATVSDLKVRKLTVLGGLGNGSGDVTGRVIAASEQLKAVTGVDLIRAFQERVSPPSPRGGSAP